MYIWSLCSFTAVGYNGRTIPHVIFIYENSPSLLRAVFHEVFHALGRDHEQQRNDRDFYVRILWENILPGELHTIKMCKILLTHRQGYNTMCTIKIIHFLLCIPWTSTAHSMDNFMVIYMGYMWKKKVREKKKKEL